MIKKIRLLSYFSKREVLLWVCSVMFIVISFYIYDGKEYLTLSASLIGVTSLIFNAKGNPMGQFLMVLFGILYGIISYSFAYYGEMITYVGMTVPMAIFALISWLKNPYNGNKSEVKVSRIRRKEMILLLILAPVVTAVFYFILKALRTANIVPSTVSVTTSFVAVYLTYHRSSSFALAYAANDVVLIILWCMASIENTRYASVLVCFCVFLVNDIYTFLNWQKIKKRQESDLL